MPHVQITMLTGRTIEQKRRIVQRLTELLCEELQAKPDAVVITLVEVPRENYARGGVLKADRKANSP
ncbi:MAG TPA: tautomerase family protein [Terriglobales bacterium]|nr:tautomerase family protein [Terriglobales bacterium]